MAPDPRVTTPCHDLLPPREVAANPGSGRGLRQFRAGDLGVDPQVVQRAGQDRDDNRRRPRAILRRRAEVASLTRRQRPDRQPNHDHHRDNLHASQSTPAAEKRTPEPHPPTAAPTWRVRAPGARQRSDVASVVAGVGVWGLAVHAAARSTIRAMRLIQTSRVTRTGTRRAARCARHCQPRRWCRAPARRRCRRPQLPPRDAGRGGAGARRPAR